MGVYKQIYVASPSFKVGYQDPPTLSQQRNKWSRKRDPGRGGNNNKNLKRPLAEEVTFQLKLTVRVLMASRYKNRVQAVVENNVRMSSCSYCSCTTFVNYPIVISFNSHSLDSQITFSSFCCCCFSSLLQFVVTLSSISWIIILLISLGLWINPRETLSSTLLFNNTKCDLLLGITWHALLELAEWNP